MNIRESLEFYMKADETPEDTETIHRTLKFAKAAGDTLEGASLGEKREFICPCCKGRAMAMRRMHGSGTTVSARCSKCKMRMFS